MSSTKGAWPWVVAGGIRFCRTFLHVALVKEHTAIQESHAKQKAKQKKCDTNHIPRATAYLAQSGG